MELILYNTRTRTKAPFVPIDPDNVRMYVCGPTVYDTAHIGNARPVVVFDVLFRLLRHIYGVDHVTYARNITDVDDKINARAAERGIDIGELTKETTERFHADMAALGALPPTVEPRATEHIPEMIAIMSKLIEAGHAYAAEGHVLFHVPSMPDYGKLSGRSLEEMEAGARVEVAPYKKDPMDFVLWKPSSETEPSWSSPWGAGRPGWHLECSAMSAKHLGETFDIHGGGIDLLFPHHENEIAQSTCAHGTPVMANVWMHNGFLQVDGAKMAKSDGNFITVSELLEEWPGEVIRMAMLSTQYRQPINWTRKRLEECRRCLQGWYQVIADVEDDHGAPDDAFLAALADDLNTPQAIARLHELRRGAVAGSRSDQAALKASANLMGLLSDPDAAWLQASAMPEGVDEAMIHKAIADRVAARAAKDYAESDRIRDELAAKGIILTDGPDGTTWSVG